MSRAVTDGWTVINISQMFLLRFPTKKKACFHGGAIRVTKTCTKCVFS
jgi:hypothetical protein